MKPGENYQQSVDLATQSCKGQLDDSQYGLCEIGWSINLFPYVPASLLCRLCMKSGIDRILHKMIQCFFTDAEKAT